MSIRFDEQGITTAAWQIQWDEILALGIRTTADGPFLEDVYWAFLTDKALFELPGSAVDGAALEVMQRALEGIDSRKIVLAMGSTENRFFRVWHAEDSKTRWEDAKLRARFGALVERLGGLGSKVPDVFPRLREAWSAQERRYHDLEHLADCLRELDSAHVEQRAADTVELALWYHDAVYEPGSPDSEERSASWLNEDAVRLQVPRERALDAMSCVRATAHLHGPRPSNPLGALIADIDLSILGRDVFRFTEFEDAIAVEYAEQWPVKYELARGRFLRTLLDSPAIFHTEHFRDRYEKQARANIAALLDGPRYRTHQRLGGVYSWFIRTFAGQGKAPLTVCHRSQEQNPDDVVTTTDEQ